MSHNLELVKSELAPHGVMKVGLNLSNFLLVNAKDTSVAAKGVAPDLSREVAASLGLPIEFVHYATPGDMAEAVGTGAWTMALFAVEAARASVIDFTAPYLEIEATYLVPAGSAIQHVDEVDRAGVRISLMHKSAYDLYLSRSIQHASLVHSAGMDASYDNFVSQGLEVLAGLRPRLVQDVAKLPGARILPGRFTAVGQAIGVPKGGQAAAAYLRAFVESAKSSGLVARIIERNAVQGVTVAALV